MTSYPTPPAFAVTIPEGTESFNIETECEPWTKELNNTPLEISYPRWETEHKSAYLRLAEQTEVCRKTANFPELRPHASADCIKVLYGDLGLKPLRSSKASGKPSVDQETLTFFAHQGVKIAEQLLEARSTQAHCSQLKEWEQYAKLGAVQASWNQTGQPHGRYSCDTPNLQSRIHPVRHTIVAGRGYSFLSLDLGQAEPVTWASLSKDPMFTAALTSGVDFHQYTWDEIKKVMPDIQSFDKTERASGKTLNNAILYRMQDFSLSKRIGSDVLTARKLLEAHHARARVAWKYMEDTITHARLNGCLVETYFGRVRHIPNLRSPVRGLKHEAEKTAWHHHNAGTAAELVKLLQINTGAALRKQFDDKTVRLALQMHDELIYRVRDDVLEEAKAIALETFSVQPEGFLPFKIDCRTGYTWGDITK